MDRAAGTERSGRENRDKTAITVQSGRGIWDMTTNVTIGQGSVNGSVWWVGQTGQPGQISLDKKERTGQPGHDSKDRTAKIRELE